MVTEDGDPTTPGLSEEELQALEDRLVQKIMAKVAPKEPGSSSDAPPQKGGKGGKQGDQRKIIYRDTGW